MNGQIIVTVGGEAVMILTGFLHRVHMNHSLLQITEVVKQLVVDLSGNLMPFGNR